MRLKEFSVLINTFVYYIMFYIEKSVEVGRVLKQFHGQFLNLNYVEYEGSRKYVFCYV